MLKLSPWLLLVGFGLGMQPVASQDAATPDDLESKLVTLGDYRAHGTRILARFLNDTSEAETKQDLLDLGLSIEHRYGLVPGLVAIRVNPVVEAGANPKRVVTAVERLVSCIDTLNKSPHFLYAEPDYHVQALATPNDVALADGTLWGLRNSGQQGGVVGADISAEMAWDITTGSTNVLVAVIDTGIRYTHRELAGQMWTDPAYTNRVVYGTNAVDNVVDPLDPIDLDGHGTHVAGTIGAIANDGLPHVGVCWKVRLMACKFLGPAGGTTAGGIGCIDYAVAKGAKILNNSWGGGPFENSLRDAIVASRNRGVLFVAAAGNAGNNNDSRFFYPASYQVDNIVSVAALDRKDQLADFSNYGRTNVHLGAPGVSIYSCWNTSDTAHNTIDGTSMASPHVAGVAALILAKFPNASLLELRERLLLSVEPIPALSLTTSTGGRLNAHRALTLAPDGKMEISITPPNNSVLLASTPGKPSTEVLKAHVTDILSIFNATVTATPSIGTAATLVDNGQNPDASRGDAVYSANFLVPTNTGPLVMTFDITAPGKTNARVLINYVIVPPPVNDDFTNALKLISGTARTNLVTNNRFASVENVEPAHAAVPSSAHSLWWTYSPGKDGSVFVDTSGSSFDTVLAVYTGTSLVSLQEVASVDDIGLSRQAYLSFPGKNGFTYRIAVAGYDTNQFGTVRLRLEQGGSPDDIKPIIAFQSPLSGSVISTNRTVSIGGTASDPDPNASGVSDIQVFLNDDTVPAGAAYTNGTWVGTALLREGQNTLRAFAFDYAGNVSDEARVLFTYRVPDPRNDLFANADLLGGTSGTITNNNRGASKEYGEPIHAGNGGGHSVWWRWQAPADGVLDLETSGSTIDTLLGVYTGLKVTNLVTIAENDDAFIGSSFSKVSFAVANGQTYRIAIDGYGGASGTNYLKYNFTPAVLYSVSSAASVGGAVTSTAVGLVASNTIVRFTAEPETHYVFTAWEGSVVSTANPLEVLVTNNVSITARFGPKPYADGFEARSFSGLNWSLAGNSPWTVQSNQVGFGSAAAQSGQITHNQASSLILTAKFKTGSASFQYRVSSEVGWDQLQFLLDGTVVQSWSGSIGWSTFSFNVLEGEHTLEWRYVKDSTNTEGEDAAYLDNLDLPLMEPKILDQPVSLLRVTGETASFSISASANAPVTYRWQFNGTNLTDGGRVSGALTRALTLTAVSTNDAGQYAVVVAAPGGTGRSEPATLSILLPPEIATSPTNVTVQEGGSAQFEVLAEGQQVAYQWQRAGTNITGATTRTLLLNGVTSAAAGAYTVRVSNRAGFRAATASLTVNTLPPSVRLVSDGAGQFRIQFEGTFGQSVSVQASQNLQNPSNWTTIGSLVISSNNVPFTDLDAATHAFRFYRITIP